MGTLQWVLGGSVTVGSVTGILTFLVRESGAALVDIEDYENDEPI